MMKMRDVKDNFLKIYREHKKLLYAMGMLVFVSLVLLVYVIVNLKASDSTMKVGYGDIGRFQGGEWSSMINSGGYYDGSWLNLFEFAILSLIFGILHNLMAVKIFEKKGEAVARIFVICSILMVIFAFMIFSRLISEG